MNMIRAKRHSCKAKPLLYISDSLKASQTTSEKPLMQISMLITDECLNVHVVIVFFYTLNMYFWWIKTSFRLIILMCCGAFSRQNWHFLKKDYCKRTVVVLQLPMHTSSTIALHKILCNHMVARTGQAEKCAGTCVPVREAAHFVRFSRFKL